MFGIDVEEGGGIMRKLLLYRSQTFLGYSSPTDGTHAYLLPEKVLDKPIFKVKTRVDLPDYLDTIGIAKSENELNCCA
ncbi:hypothetical protein OH492_19070 [Vibrio chagasii]|nr:hypothetical protein [Vibrio chagasii]